MCISMSGCVKIILALGIRVVGGQREKPFNGVQCWNVESRAGGLALT